MSKYHGADVRSMDYNILRPFGGLFAIAAASQWAARGARICETSLSVISWSINPLSFNDAYMCQCTNSSLIHIMVCRLFKRQAVNWTIAGLLSNEKHSETVCPRRDHLGECETV